MRANLSAALLAILAASATSYAKESTRNFPYPCHQVYPQALSVAREKYHDVTEVTPGQTLEMETGNRWKDGELTLRVHLEESTPDACTVTASSLTRGPLFRDGETFLKRLSDKTK